MSLQCILEEKVNAELTNLKSQVYAQQVDILVKEVFANNKTLYDLLQILTVVDEEYLNSRTIDNFFKESVTPTVRKPVGLLQETKRTRGDSLDNSKNKIIEALQNGPVFTTTLKHIDRYASAILALKKDRIVASTCRGQFAKLYLTSK
jgi:hypothetical protein